MAGWWLRLRVATCAEQGSAAVVGRMAETVKQLLEQVGAEEEELAVWWRLLRVR